MKKILVLGGTGFIGRHICEKLVRAQIQVTVPTRRYDNARDIIPLPMVQVLVDNPHDEASLQRLVAGHDAVINLIAILHGSEAQFEDVHVALVNKLIRACAAQGVRRVVHVSALGAAVNAPSRYLRSKGRGEAALKAADLDLTLLRPSVVFGSDDKFTNLFASLQKLFPFIPLAGSSAKFQPVWVEDVAQAAINTLLNDRFIGKTLELGGPDVLNFADLVRKVGHHAGIRGGLGRPIIALPDSLGRLQARLMELAPGEPMMSRDNLDSMKVDNVLTGTLPGLSDSGITAASLDAILPRYLRDRGPRSGLDGMRKTAGRF